MTSKKIVIISFVIVLFPFIFIGTFFRRLVESGKIKRGEHRFLIIDNAKIGDIVCATPVFRAIKEAYPNCHISIIVNPKTVGILKNNPQIDKIVPSDFSVPSFFRLLHWSFRSRFTASVALVPGTMNFVLPYISLIPARSVATAPEYGKFYRLLAVICSTWRKRFMPNTLSVQYYLDLLIPFGIKNCNLKKEVYISTESRQKTDSFFRLNAVDPQVKLVGFSVTAGNSMKEWPIEKFLDVAHSIYKEYSYVPFILGSASDTEYIEKCLPILKQKNVPYLTATSFLLEDLPALISRFSFFVSVDTGTLYIANALDIPVVDIAGPCNIYDQMPIYEKCEVVYIKDLPDWPYTSVLKTITKLDSKQMRCIDDITPQMVLESFRILHAKYPPNETL